MISEPRIKPEALTTIIEKLGYIQGKLSVPKDQTNSFGNYKYRSCEDILEAVKPLLKETGCSLVISDEIVFISGASAQAFTVKEWSKDAKQMVELTQIVGGDRFYVKATATLKFDKDSISVSGFAREPESKKGMDDSQITGATSSYARKYALNGLFCIDDTKDADCTNTHAKEPVKAVSEPVKVSEKSGEKSLKDSILEKAQVLFKDPDTFKIWRTDNGYADDLNKASGLDLTKLLLALKDKEKLVSK